MKLTLTHGPGPSDSVIRRSLRKIAEEHMSWSSSTRENSPLELTRDREGSDKRARGT